MADLDEDLDIEMENADLPHEVSYPQPSLLEP